MAQPILLLVLASETDAVAYQRAGERLDIDVLPTSALMQALGEYIVSFPNAVLIDAAHPDAEATLMHLLSVDAAPLLLRTSEPVPAWVSRAEADAPRRVAVLLDTNTASILECAQMMARTIADDVPRSLNEPVSA